MWILWIALALLVGLPLLAWLPVMVYIAYRKAFGPLKEAPLAPGELDLPREAAYRPYMDRIISWQQQLQQLPSRRVSVRSFDGATLYGTFYEYRPDAPVEILFHGYRGRPLRDLSGGVQRCFALGRSCLMVEQRGCGQSQGREVTFGIKERRDCRAWVEYAIQSFGPEVKIFLAGMSMGAATVLMAAGETLPPNVKGVIADCGFTSPREIVRKVMKDNGMPVDRVYPLVRLGARVFGRFDLEETSPEQALKSCTVPVFFVHGDADEAVPLEMARRNFEACSSRKQLLVVPGAGHGLCLAADWDGYIRELKAFFGEEMAQ